MNKKSLFKKIWDITTTIIVAVVVLCAIFLMGCRLIGLRAFNVISGSMAPKYNVGDLIFVKETDPEDVKVGQPITFVLNENLVVATHRVVRIDTEKKLFYTMGDTNDIEDAPVHFENLIGVPQFGIPLLGYVSKFIQTPPGTYYAIGIGAILIVAVFLPDFFAKKGSKEDDPEETQNTENS